MKIFALARKIRGEEPMFPEKGGGGGGKSTTTTKVEPWVAAQGDLKNVLKLAQKEFDKSGGLSGQWINQNLPGLTPEMKASLSELASSGQLKNIAQHVNDNLGQVQQKIDQGGQAVNQYGAANFDITGKQINDLASQLYDNETVRSQKEQLTAAQNEQLGNQVQELNQAANAAGAMGNSRAGVAQGVMTGKTNEAIAKGTADIMNAARGQAQQGAISTLQGNQSIKANQAANTMQGKLGLINSQLGLESQRTQNAQLAGNLYQQAMTNRNTAANVTQQRADLAEQMKYENQVNKQNAGWENLQKYQSMVSQIAGQGSSGTSTAPGAQGPSRAQSALGGAMSGAASGAMIGSVVPGVGTAVGAVAGGIIGGASGLFSDASLKDKVKATGKTKSGDTTYDWEWKEEAKKKNKKLKGKSSGVLAQDVAANKPEAVGKSKGALMVDYDQTSVKPSKSSKKK